MSHELRSISHVESEVLFALAAGELSELEAKSANAHLAVCRGCRRLYTGARELQREALHLGDDAARGVDEVTHRRLWRSLAPEAAAAAQRVQHRRAWSIVLASPRLRWAAAILVLVGAGLVAYGLGWDGGPPAADATIDGAAAAQREARALALPSGLGPGTTAKLVGPVKAARQRPQRRRQRPNGARGRQGMRPESSVTMDLDLTGPLDPPPRTGGYVAAPGERKLRCGGILASGTATVQVLRDRPKAALIRLHTGRVDMRVPKLRRGGRVEILTPDARVRVVGTRFSVRRGKQPQTLVSVSEGVVWVTPTGRNRKTVVLRAGESRAVLGEAAYLKQLEGQLSAALGAGRLKDAARLGRRYLDVISKPARAATMKLRLAGILARLGLTGSAVKLYQSVMGSASHAVARQNALAFLARLYERIGKSREALGIWRRLVHKHPGGLFAVDALMALVRAECRQPGASQVRHRRQLARHASGHRGARALLGRCALAGGGK